MKRAALFGLVVTGCVAGVAMEGGRTGKQTSAITLSTPVNVATFESYAKSFLFPRGFTNVGTKVVFGAQSYPHGSEPWVTDGTEAGTSMILDMNGGPANGYVASAPLGGSAILALDDGAHGVELWKSDGTAAGTTLVKDLHPGSYGGVASLFAGGGLVYATVTGNADAVVNAVWRTDGSGVGTFKLADTTSDFFADANGTVFFRGTGGLWKSNGTAAGTTLVSSTVPSYVSATGSMVAAGGSVYFVNQANTRELWKSDGTTTALLHTFPNDVDRIVSTGAKVFVRSTNASARYELWATDGGTPVSVTVPSASGNQYLDELVPSNGALYFIADNGTSGTELWKSDGTSGGTAMIADLLGGGGAGAFAGIPPVAWNDGVAFSGTNVAGAYEPYFTNGGTPVRVVDAVAGSGSSTPHDFFVNGTTLYFMTSATPFADQLWKSTGVGNGTLVKELNAPAIAPAVTRPRSGVSLNGALYFSAGLVTTPGSHARQLWKSDGTKAGTAAVTSIANDGLRDVDGIVVAAGKLYFGATSAGVGNELHTSDGTAAGSVLAADVPPSAQNSYPTGIVAAGPNVFFAATGSEGQETFRYSAAGGLVQITNSLRVLGSEPKEITAFGSGAYFSGQSTNQTRDLRYNDGASSSYVTASGGGNGDLTVFNPVAVGNTLFFVHVDATYGRELWKASPGVAASIVKDIVAGGSSFPESLTAVGNQLFFVASSDANKEDRELWVSDGTANGTVLVKDLYTGLNPKGGPGGSRPRRLTAVGNKLVFVADDGTGDKWFVSNGTAAGTYALGSAAPGSCGPMGTDAIVFVCAVDAAGNELWTSDGTAGSLARWLDLAPGPTSSNPELVAVQNGKVFFSALVSGKLEMYAADLLAPGGDAGTEGGPSGSSGGSSGSSTSTSTSTSTSGGTKLDDHEADGQGITEESGCSVAAAGMRKKRGR